MADEHANTDSAILDTVRILKSKIPPADHAALDSRVQELMADPTTMTPDFLRQEFDPEEPEESDKSVVALVLGMGPSPPIRLVREALSALPDDSTGYRRFVPVVGQLFGVLSDDHHELA